MFPSKPFNNVGHFGKEYFAELSKAAHLIDVQALSKAAAILSRTIVEDKTIFACGNGGSAAISNHLLCDFAKGIQTDTILKPKIISLSSHVEMITAIGNDIGFEEIFLYQLKTSARLGDTLLTISSSGNSTNIVGSVEWARSNGVNTIALTGFDGGGSAKLADINIHVPSDNYGIIEDLHQSCMHILAQFVRMNHMPPEMIGMRKF